MRVCAKGLACSRLAQIILFMQLHQFKLEEIKSSVVLGAFFATVSKETFIETIQ